jgi:hypothetical protein
MDRRLKCDPPSTLRLAAITPPEGERFLTATWRILVEHDLASPKIEVRPAGALIDISLHFSSVEDCALVKKRFYQIRQSTDADG